MRNGIVFPLPPLALPTAGTESGLLPTLRATQWKNRYWCRFREDHHSNLDEFIGSMYPEIIGQPINPHWLEWFMGYPTGWACPRPSVTP
jgi:hypothetical protein